MPVTTCCGCGRHEIITDGEESVYHSGKWWAVDCIKPILFPELEKLRKRLQETLNQLNSMKPKFIRMKNLFRSTPCDSCNQMVGNRFTIHGGNRVICGACTKKEGDEKP